MSLLDLIVILVVLIVGALTPLPWGVWVFVLVALIVERFLKGERL